MKEITYGHWMRYMHIGNHPVIYVEQLEFSDKTSFYAWEPNEWDSEEKEKASEFRAAYFIVRPKTNR